MKMLRVLAWIHAAIWPIATVVLAYTAIWTGDDRYVDSAFLGLFVSIAAIGTAGILTAELKERPGQ